MARYLQPSLADMHTFCWREEIERRRGREMVLHSSTAFYPVEQEGFGGTPLGPIPEEEMTKAEGAARKIRQWAPSGYLINPGRVALELELIPSEEIPILREQWLLLVMTNVDEARKKIPWKGDYLCQGCLTPNFRRNVKCRECTMPRPSHESDPSGLPSLKIKTRGDWKCPRCSDFVFGKNPFCRKCQFPQLFASDKCFELAAIMIEKGEAPNGKKKKKNVAKKKRTSNLSSKPTVSTSAESDELDSMPSTCQIHGRRSSFASTCVDEPLRGGSPNARQLWSMAQTVRQCQEEEELHCGWCQQGTRRFFLWTSFCDQN